MLLRQSTRWLGRVAIFCFLLLTCIGLQHTPHITAATLTSSANTFTSTDGPIAIAENGSSPKANPYPSEITVSGLTGNISDINVTLTDLRHASLRDTLFLLQSPAGTYVNILNRRGEDFVNVDVDLTFDDESANGQIPASQPVASGTYRPSGNTCTDPFPAPVTSSGSGCGASGSGPWPKILSAFDGEDPNGTWKLYAMDWFPGDHDGSLAAWSLGIETQLPVNLSVSTNSASEAAGTTVTVSAVASDPVDGAQTVDVTVSGVASGDFTLSNDTITIPSGQSSGSVTFTVVDDDIYEGDETATLNISNPTSGIQIGATNSQAITIADNEPPQARINGSDCGLADAITAANTDSVTGDCNAGSGDDTITLLTDVTLSAALPNITTNITIEGDGHFIDGNASVRVMQVSGAAGDLTLNETTLQNGKTTADSASGAGLYVHTSGRATLTNSTVSGNSTTGFASEGGGIAVEYGGGVTLTNSTVSGNSTADSASGGGGIFVQDASVTLTNSTVSGNSTADSASEGGGIFVQRGSVTLTNNIVVGNSADAAGDELYFTGSPTLTNNGGNVLGSSAGSRAANFTGFTPSANDFDASSDQQNTATAAIINPTLTDNGGATLTHALVNSSPAIDAGGATCSVATDQRGQARNDLGCDIGAVEVVFTDSPTIVEEALDDGETATFGPTRVRIARSGGAAPGSITVTKILTETEDDQAFDLIWQVRADNPTGLNLDISFCYTESEIPEVIVGNEGGFTIYRQPDSGGAFSELITTVDAPNNCVTAAVNEFSNFGIGLAAPTAVVLDYFDATANSDGTVTVDWETASEINHAGFNLYRRPANSRDNWAAINTQLIASHGTQAQGATYQFVEQGVLAGAWEYLLEDVENDGDTHRHVDATVMVVVETPTAVTLTTRTAFVGSASGWLVQFVGLLLITLGAIVRQRGHVDDAPTRKPTYSPPTVTSYTVAALQQQLGPARAYSENRQSLDEALLFGEAFRDR